MRNSRWKTKLKPLDYDLLREETKQTRVENEKLLHQLKKMEDFSKSRKKVVHTETHQNIWRNELKQIQHEREKLERILTQYMEGDGIIEKEEQDMKREWQLARFRLEKIKQMTYQSVIDESLQDVQETIQNLETQLQNQRDRLQNFEKIDQMPVISFNSESFPFMNDDFKQNLQNQLTSLDLLYRQKLANISKEMSDLDDGLTDRECSFFVKKIFREYAHHQQWKRLIRERLKMERKHWSHSEITKQIEAHQTRKILHHRRNAIRNEWKEKREAFYEDCFHRLKDSLLSYPVRIESYQQEMRAWRERKDKDIEFVSLKRLKVQEILENQEKVQQKLENELQFQQKKEEKERKLKKSKQNRIKQWQNALEEEKMLHSLQVEKKKMQENIEKREKIRLHVERTRFRALEYQKRREERILQTLQKQKEEEEKKKKFEHLIEKLKVHSSSDIGRTMSETEAFRRKNQQKQDQSFYSMHGFSDDSILNDKKFRVEHALRNAGLLHTQYASDLLKSMSSNQNKSNFELAS